MRVGIVTLPLHHNYGGILQNWALQQVLVKLGHHPMTIDAYVRYPYSHYCIKKGVNFLLKVLGKPALVLTKPYKGRATDKLLGEFITNHIRLTKPVNEYNARLVKKYKFDAIVVGSDQIWRPKYNKRIETAFLDFLKGEEIRRIGFSVSLGCDEWEYSAQETANCQNLIQSFSGVSVREESGLSLLSKHLDYRSELTIDPTLLLSSNDYLSLCQNIPVNSASYLAVYCLDLNSEFLNDCEKLAMKLNLPLFILGADGNCSVTVQQWLAVFRDASRVITDSFHGTIFSLLFGKPVKVYRNEDRGKSRFDTLFTVFDSIEDDYGFKRMNVNSSSFRFMKEKSIGYLRTHLQDE